MRDTYYAERIVMIERRLGSAGAVQVAGLLHGRSPRIGSPRGLVTVPVDDPTDPGTVLANNVAMARTLLIRATERDLQGDKRICEDTMSETRSMIGAVRSALDHKPVRASARSDTILTEDG